MKKIQRIRKQSKRHVLLLLVMVLLLPFFHQTSASADEPVSSGYEPIAYPSLVTGYLGAMYSIGMDYRLSVWGDNSEGQLGITNPNNGTGQTIPVKNATLANVLMKEIFIGYDGGKTVYALTQNGEVYAWGYGDERGMLGTGKTIPTTIPEKVVDKDNKPIKDVEKLVVYNNGETIFAITSFRTVYTWGVANKTGISGTSESTNSTRARLVVRQGDANTLRGIDDLVAGTAGSMYAVDTATGEVYAWGDNSKGQLAAGDTMNEVWRNRKAIALSETTDGNTWTGDNSEWIMDVTVPIGLTFGADVNGNLIVPSEGLEIVNNGSQPVKVVSSEYTKGDWKLVNTTPSQNFNSKEFKIATNQFGDSKDLLSVVKKELPNQVVWGNRWSTQGNALIELVLNAKNSPPIAPQTAIRTQSAGAISLVLAWF